MIVKSIAFTAFRNFSHNEFIFDKDLTIIIGANARGKTNLLEGMYVAVRGTGFRESKEEELMQWQQTSSIVETRWAEKAGTTLFTVAFHRRGESVEKSYLINKTKKNHVVYQQYQSKAVLFAPQHIDIVTGSPDLRREYFNKVIFSYDPEYKKSVQNYEHALYKRNKVLEHHKNEDTLQEELLFWDEYLEKQAEYITQKRGEYIGYLNKHPQVEEKTFRIEYLKNELTQERLRAIYAQERRMRRTLIGPQKDDFHIFLSNKPEKNIHHFGSRSEQRLGVFWLKLNEINFYQQQFKIKPVLLLDDIFSELDVKNKKLVLDLIGNYQTIFTTTEKDLLTLAPSHKSIIQL